MAMMSYAQNREDVLLNRLFPDRPSGFYIDVGACYPVLHSVTKWFYERGWHGINIEPIPSLSESLVHYRPRDINLRVGLSNVEGTSTFYECRTSVELSTFSQEQAGILRRRDFEIVEHSIPITTLARVCEGHAEGTIDFLKIDVEGYERQVLEGADWGRHRPRVVLVEATRPETDIPSHEHWEPLLLEADYLFAFFDGLNRFYVRAEDRNLLPLLKTPANVLDQYEIHEYHSRILDLQHAIGASQAIAATMQTSLDDCQHRLVETQAALLGAQDRLEDTEVRLQVSRAQMDTTQARLEATHARLEATQARLEATQAKLAPIEDLGPIAIGVAQKIRQMSVSFPQLAEIAKRLIRGPRWRDQAAAQDA